MSGRDRMTVALFDAVGQIDDSFVAEALEYKKKIKRKSLFKTLSGIAAVVVIIAISVPAFFGIKNALNSLYSEKEKALTLSAGEELGEGVTALIWQRSGQTDYSYVEISDDRAQTLIEEITGDPVGSRVETEIRVWIKLGSGEYISPQLKRSSGNTGLYLFDFSPEVELSGELKNIIKSLSEND